MLKVDPIWDNVRDAPIHDDEVIRPLDRPLCADGAIAVPHGWGHNGSGGWKLANRGGGVNVNTLMSTAPADVEVRICMGEACQAVGSRPLRADAGLLVAAGAAWIVTRTRFGIWLRAAVDHSGTSESPCSPAM